MSSKACVHDNAYVFHVCVLSFTWATTVSSGECSADVIKALQCKSTRFHVKEEKY